MSLLSSTVSSGRTLHYQPKKVGIRYDPPAVVMDYVVIATGRRRRRVMPVRGLHAGASIEDLASDLDQRHGRYLSTISMDQLESLLARLKQGRGGGTASAAVIDGEENLNRLGDEELQQRKAVMNEVFEKNRVTQEHPDFVYDKQAAFNAVEKSGWDDTDDDDDESDGMW
eukprot:m.24051 g.24051  ORF g.24051 m.24051 type:complete len:170 (+) comp7376_c0_seq1:178-687(+)